MICNDMPGGVGALPQATGKAGNRIGNRKLYNNVETNDMFIAWDDLELTSILSTN